MFICGRIDKKLTKVRRGRSSRKKIETRPTKGENQNQNKKQKGRKQIGQTIRQSARGIPIPTRSEKKRDV
jgi:hypothetical protein